MKTRGVTAMAEASDMSWICLKSRWRNKPVSGSRSRFFHKFWPLIHDGDYYRLSGPSQPDCQSAAAAWEFAAPDKSEVLVNLVALECHGNPPDRYVKLKGLERAALYRDESSGRTYRAAPR